MTVDQLKTAGFTDEAERLARAICQANLWTFRGSAGPSDRAIALSLFGSVRFDQLAEAIGIPGWSHR